MAIKISDIESEQYGRHYGATKAQALYLGEGLSPGTSLNGNIRGIVDSVTISTINLDAGEIIWGWKFLESVTILGGTIRVHQPELGSGNLLVSLYTGDNKDASKISRLFDVVETDDLTFHSDLYTPSIFPDVPKGCVVGLLADSSPVLVDVEIRYSLIFLTNL